MTLLKNATQEGPEAFIFHVLNENPHRSSAEELMGDNLLEGKGK